MTVKRELQKATRIARDVEAITDPVKGRRRVKNLVLSSILGAFGFWRLWRRFWA